MESEVARVLLLFFSVLFVLTCFVLWLAWKNRPKWRKCYDFVRNIMYQHYLDDDVQYYNIIELKYIIAQEFNITLEQSIECMNNWKKEEWFESQEFLKDDTSIQSPK